MMKNWKLLLVIPLLAVLVACSGSTIVTDTKGERMLGGTTEGAADSPLFILGAGDEISFNVWRHEDLKRTLQIDPSGNVYVPLAGTITAAGLTPTQLRDKIILKLSKYIVDPQVDINISALKSQKIHVFGEVRNPGTIVLDEKTSLWDAVVRSGWFTDDADKSKVILVRSQKNMVTIASYDMNKIFKTGKLNQDLYLRSGDVVYVPPSFIANLEKFMQRFNNIINPFITVEKGIVLAPEVRDVFTGRKSQTTITIAQ